MNKSSQKQSEKQLECAGNLAQNARAHAWIFTGKIIELNGRFQGKIHRKWRINGKMSY